MVLYSTAMPAYCLMLRAASKQTTAMHLQDVCYCSVFLQLSLGTLDVSEVNRLLEMGTLQLDWTASCIKHWW
jgi:hypothetical protein